jgi:hypothetical protein
MNDKIQKKPNNELRGRTNDLGYLCKILNDTANPSTKIVEETKNEIPKFYDDALYKMCNG